MQIQMIPLKNIISDKKNPRKSSDEEEEIKELAENIKKYGQHKPLDVEDLGNGEFYNNDGNRRHKAQCILHGNDSDALIPCIVGNKLSEEERLMKQCYIDTLHKKWSESDRHEAWLKLYKMKNSPDKKTFALLVGANKFAMNVFFSRIELDDELVKDIGDNTIKETQGMQKDDRERLLKRIKKEGMGRQEIRNIRKTMTGTPDKLKNAIIDGDIVPRQAEEISKLSEDKQELAVENIKSANESIDKIPELTKNTKIKPKNQLEERKIDAGMFVRKLIEEYCETSTKIRVLRSALETIENDNLEQYFNPKMKDVIKENARQFNVDIKRVIDISERFSKKWQ